ncbi:DNA-dependent metalloprotease dvc-1 [Aricia agestis]|uniref:DNA-dependent metalloprotease dvc-1 n=1 Tax=Aricia agestis TaxID=91739 RepID=UPI001C2031D1|nr:DNA-dependent metalloprotease dvc-1 [Aricia agestis]
MNLGDPELELIDPTPNVHALFVHFDKLFFWTSLASRAIVRWSKRMYSCAGICSYDRVGLCEIALSEPLLKLRPRKDLVETLLHEMIHAYLFITNRDRDRDGHGPNFQAHMHRINKSAGLNISIYHDFHDEVKLYQTHWWRCNGPCQKQRPYFGIVRRSANRAPGPNDRWWLDHQRKCGGTFVKIKEPEKKTRGPKPKNQNADITKYVTSNTKSNKDINENLNNPKSQSVLKDSNMNPKIKTISSYMTNNTLIVNKKNVIFNPTATKLPVEPFTGTGQTIGSKKKESISDITETVRNIWASKMLTSDNIKNNSPPKIVSGNNKKHKTVDITPSPPKKVMKIDDYFKNNAKTILKDLYSQDFVVTQNKNDNKLNVLPVVTNLVECPICKMKISSEEINRHLDECLNKDIIEKISNDTNVCVGSEIKENTSESKVNKPNDLANDSDIVEVKKQIDLVDLTWIDEETQNNNKIRDSKGDDNNICPCCGNKISKGIQEHLDECLVFFDNNETMPEEGASSTSMIDTIVLDDDDEFDETLTLNATGTKSPCPCCLEMVEQADMNDHLDICLR